MAHLFSLTILVSIIGCSVSICPAWKETNNMGYKSSWWTEVHALTWLSCNQKCNENSNCKYWSWHVPNGNKWQYICRLIEKPTRVVHGDVNVISGIKCDACSFLPGIKLENPENNQAYKMQTPQECPDKCNQLGTSCNYWSWKMGTNNICTTMTNFTMMEDDDFAISGSRSNCQQNSNDSVPTLGATVSLGSPTVIIPPGIPGWHPSTEYNYFTKAWRGTDYGRSFVSDVQRQAQEYFNENRSLGGFRVNFRIIPNNPGINNYEDLVTQTGRHIVGQDRNFIREMLYDRHGARAIMNSRAMRAHYDDGHLRNYRLWQRQVETMESEADIEIGIVSSATYETAWGSFISGISSHIPTGARAVSVGTSSTAAGTGFIAASQGTGFTALRPEISTIGATGATTNAVTFTSVLMNIISFLGMAG